MSHAPASKINGFPKAYGHELLENLSLGATRVAVGLISYWLLKLVAGSLPLPSGWVRELPGIMAIGIFCFVLMSQRVALQEELNRWRYVASFGLVFWLGTLFQAGYLL